MNSLVFIRKYPMTIKLIEEITYSGKNEIESKTIFEYDANGRIVKEMNYFDEDEFSDGSELEYNDHDQLETIRIKYADGSKTIQRYERQPNFSKISYFNEDNELEYIEERRTNENNNLIEFIKFGPNNELENKVSFLYDDKHRLIESQENNILEDFKSFTRMDYDDKNNPVKEITYTEKGNVMNSRLFTYNDKNEVIQEVVNDYTVTYQFNDKGHRTERKITNISGQLEELNTFNFDEDGRLIEERFYKSIDLNAQDIFRTAYLRKRYEYQ
jgi:hypothetical protein